MQKQTFITSNNIHVLFTKQQLDNRDFLNEILPRLDNEKGMILSSGIDYPGRYNRWEVGFVNPPVEVIAKRSGVTFSALNPRGIVILQFLKSVLLQQSKLLSVVEASAKQFKVLIAQSSERFPEELRSHQPSLVTPLNILIQEFAALKENMLGFYGAFGYELLYEFDPCQLKKSRTGEEEIYHLFFVDELYVHDKQLEHSYQLTLEFLYQNQTTVGQSTKPYYVCEPVTPEAFQSHSDIEASWSDDDFAQKVNEARDEIRMGNIFEVVLARELSADISGSRADLYQKMKKINPSPYEYFCQLGSEQIIGTSPEMFVRCEGDLVETCPISGTIKRGTDAIEDELQIRKLLNSYKDEVELTMCTDVDRNDKSRICQPGSVELISRRSIEKYSGLFHTVDHVKGILRDGFTGLDAFLSHMWAVTLTGAPKKRAAQIIEEKEAGLRHWYGGAVGCIGFNGDVNSAIAIRTIHIKNNIAKYRVGATLVWDSDGLEEAEETKTKATLFYKALDQYHLMQQQAKTVTPLKRTVNALMVDYEDSFVHTLANYFRQLGVNLVTYRSGSICVDDILAKKVDLVIHSPGPGQPSDFDLPAFVNAIAQHNIPQFGICLGLQGMVQACGGEIMLLDEPKHGKKWHIKHTHSGMFAETPQQVEVAAYHSLIANPVTMPEVFKVEARNEHGDVMAIRHQFLPLSAVQFHPESILTLKNNTGLTILKNAIIDLLGISNDEDSK